MKGLLGIIQGPFLALIAAPGFLFLLYWLLARREQKSIPSVG
jgi:hypothetical protein